MLTLSEYVPQPRYGFWWSPDVTIMGLAKAAFPPCNRTVLIFRSDVQNPHTYIDALFLNLLSFTRIV